MPVSPSKSDFLVAHPEDLAGVVDAGVIEGADRAVRSVAIGVVADGEVRSACGREAEDARGHGILGDLRTRRLDQAVEPDVGPVRPVGRAAFGQTFPGQLP